MGKVASRLNQVLAHYGYLCFYCNRKATSVDHIIPLAKGGANTLANKRPACKRCNNLKSDMILSDFVKFFPEIIRKDFVIVPGELAPTYNVINIPGVGRGYTVVKGQCVSCGKDYKRVVHFNDAKKITACSKECKRRSKNKYYSKEDA